MKTIFLAENRKQLEPAKAPKENSFSLEESVELSGKEFREIDSAARHISENWFKEIEPEIRELITYKGINLGYLASYNLMRNIVIEFSKIEKTRKILFKEKPEKIIAPSGSLIKKMLELLEFKGEVKETTAYRNFFGFSDFRQLVLGLTSDRTAYWRYLLLHLLKRFSFPKKSSKNSLLISSPYFPRFTSLMDRLSSRHELILLDNDPRYVDYLLSKNCSFSVFSESLISNEVKREAESKRGDLAKASLLLSKSKKLNEVVRFNGVNAFPLLEKLFKNIVEGDFYSSVLYIEATKKIASEKNVSGIVVWSDIPLFERSVVAACKRNSIPSIVIQHGISEGDKTGFLPLFADKFAAWDESSREQFIRLGMDRKRIDVIGNPRFDVLPAIKFDRRKTLQGLGISPEKKVVLFASQPVLIDYAYNNKKVREERNNIVISSAEKIGGTHLVILCHMAESKEEFAGLVKGRKNVTVLKPKESDSVFHLINACDALVTCTSTTTIEAILLGKPLLIVNPSAEKCPVIFPKEGVAIEVKNEKEFAEKIKKVLFDAETQNRLRESRKKFLKKNYSNIDGKATERIVELIEKTAKK